MTATAAHNSYRHEALLYDGDAAFLAGTLDFVHDGLDLGQPCLVALPSPRLATLTDALGSDAREVELVDMTELGDNPARIIPAWREFVDARGRHGAPVRGIGEPAWFGRGPAELDECALHEALLNVAVAPDEPLWLRCPYDVSRLDPRVVQAARDSHPALIEAGEHRGSRSYAGVVLVDELFATALPEPPDPHERMQLASGDLAGMRHSVGEYALSLAMPQRRVDDLVLAVTELATNSLRHGDNHGVLRMWHQGAEAVVCEVTDGGRIDDPLVGRHAPAGDDEGGRGVWMANQLCDLVQVRSSTEGTVVRVLVRIG